MAIVMEFDLEFIKEGCCIVQSIAKLAEEFHHKHLILMAKIECLILMEALYHMETYSIVLIRGLMEQLFV